MIHFDIPVLLIQLLTFGVAATIVWKFAWKPLLAMIANRQGKINADLSHAEEMRRAVAKLEEEYQLKLRQIEEKSTELIEAARAQAIEAQKEIAEQAQKEAIESRRKHEEQLQIERNIALKELRWDLAHLVLGIADKVVRATVDEKVHERRLQEILSELDRSKLPDSGGAS